MPEPKAGRLHSGIRPRDYRIHLTVLPKERRFFGNVSIGLELDAAQDVLRLHALDLEVDRATIASLPCALSHDPASETITLRPPEALPAGEASLSLHFSGTLNRHMRGLYEAHAAGEIYAFTQFEATDARRMFPCFDEPGMKARFQLSVTVPADLVALSNMPLLEERLEGEMKTLRFDETPVMSTYLLALAVARLEKKEIEVEGARVAVWTLPGQMGLGDFALKVTAGVLPLLNDYFALPCPTPKLDLVSVPDFAMGAMENWGAIFFRDSRLLLDEAHASTTTQRAVANVITHEIVHQWFGNLVTMAWWDDLWLNESFATWLACKIVDQWRPEWQSWLGFQEEKAVPLALDALYSTRPIRAAVTSPAQIEEMFDVLTYEKGAACLRMIEQFVGETPFREGIRRYMKRYQYQNAEACALWAELSAASDRPISEIAEDWFTRPGFPMVAIDSEGEGFNHIVLSQSRFFANADHGPSDETPWSIPLSLRYRDAEGTHSYSTLLKASVTRLSLPATGRVQWVYGNAGESGFFRNTYGAPLGAALQEVLRTELDAAERSGYLGHLWALTYRGDLPIASFMDTIGRLKGDDTRVVVTALCAYLEILSHQLLPSSERSRFASFVRGLLNPIWKTVLWDPLPGEDDDRRWLRADLLWTLGTVGQDDDILSELPRRQTRYQAKADSLDPTLLTAFIRLCAHSDGGTRFDFYLGKFERSVSPEERDRYLIALADFSKPALARKFLAYTLTEAVRPQDVWKPMRSLLSHPAVQGEAWTYLKANWLAFKTKGGSIGAQRMIQATRSLWRSDWHDEVKAFFSLPENRVPSAERAFAQTLEFIQLGIGFKERQAQGLSDWLRNNVKVP